MTGRRLVLFYDYVPDILARREPHRAEHLARIRAEVDAGRILAAGALGDPPTSAAIVFAGTDADAVARFAAADPYVVAGLVSAHRIVPWNVVAAR